MKDTAIHNIWMLSREYGDLAGAGGVKDMVRQLAASLVRKSRMRLSVVMPCYGFIDLSAEGFVPLGDPDDSSCPLSFEVDMDYADRPRRERCRVWYRDDDGVKIYLIDSDRFREKSQVYTYTKEENVREGWKQPGAGHFDFFAMNVLHQKSALELMILLGEKPDVLHCHDGHTALIPALINECQGWRSYFRSTGCLVTIHNAGQGYHQEVHDLEFAAAVTGFSSTFVNACLLGGRFDPFLAAGHHGLLNTVSENYARELQETDEDWRTGWLGHALLDRGVRIGGITNGISLDTFDTSSGQGLASRFDPADPGDDLAGKKECKRAFLADLAAGKAPDGVEYFGSLNGVDDIPLFAFIGRLSEQKGVDVLLEALNYLAAGKDSWQMVVLGNGMELMEADIIGLTEQAPTAGRMAFARGYHTGVARQLYAASDFFIIPSRFEPCGLTDFIAQLHASVPIVHHVGGLVKVLDGVTGLTYRGDQAEPLQDAFMRALELYKDKTDLRKIRQQAVDNIRENHTWEIKGEKYRELYLQAKQSRRKGVSE